MGNRRPRMQLAAAMVGATLALAASVRADIITGLTNHYSFNDSANPGRDDSGNLRHAAINAVTWVNDPLMGGAMDYDAAGDWLRAPLPNLNSPSPARFTIALWA